MKYSIRTTLSYLFLFVLASFNLSLAQNDIIAYIECDPGPCHICYMNLDGDMLGQVYLPNGREIYYEGENQLCWSPDGEHLAFASEVNGNLDIYTIKADGTDLQRITTNSGQDKQPSWSPNGKSIAYISNRNDLLRQDIYVCDLATGQEKRLTAVSDSFSCPVWSKDNLKIAFIKRSYPLQGQIYLIYLGPDSISSNGILPHPMALGNLRWDPKGNTLVFSSNLLVSNVYIYKMDGDSLQKVISNPMILNIIPTLTQPSWSMEHQILYTRTSFPPLKYYLKRVNQDGTNPKTIATFNKMPRSPIYRIKLIGLPDLIVSYHSSEVHANGSLPPKYIVRFKVKNIGRAISNPTSVYINAIDPFAASGTNEIKIQKTASIQPLGPNSSSGLITITFDLAEITTDEVSKIEILVDPKNMVKESLETNNTAEWIWP
jgi:WD40 repeat protein